MRAELKRYNSIGNREGIILLCQKLLTGREVDLDSIQTACSFINGVTLNFNCGVMLFEDMGLISVHNRISVARSLLFTDIEESTHKLCKYCLTFLDEEQMLDYSLVRYDASIDSYYLPKYSFKQDASLIRNILFTLGAIQSNDGSFIIAKGFEAHFAKLIEKKKTKTQAKLLEDLEKERQMGEEGESFVLNYEKRRCPFTDYQLNRIKQISLIDVSAGYDILSWEDETSNRRRYIEVKTFLGPIHFHWSSGEIEASKMGLDDYCLYLVDYSQIENIEYIPQIIRNPYKVVVNEDGWQMTPSTYYVVPKGHSQVNQPDASQTQTPEKTNWKNNLRLNPQEKPDVYFDEDISEENKYTSFLPQYDVKIACSALQDEGIQSLTGGNVQVECWRDISGVGKKINRNMFIVEAKGESMLPKIRPGDLCVFELYGVNGVAGSREGEIVLATSPSRDVDYLSRYTIKKYHSEKRQAEDSWEHSKIQLIPLNPAFKTIEISPDNEDFRVFAIYRFKL